MMLRTSLTLNRGHYYAKASADVYGGMAIVEFADRSYRVGLTADFATLRPVMTVDQLVDLDWLDQPVSS